MKTKEPEVNEETNVNDEIYSDVDDEMKTKEPEGDVDHALVQTIKVFDGVIDRMEKIKQEFKSGKRSPYKVRVMINENRPLRSNQTGLKGTWMQDGPQTLSIEIVDYTNNDRIVE